MLTTIGDQILEDVGSATVQQLFDDLLMYKLHLLSIFNILKTSPNESG